MLAISLIVTHKASRHESYLGTSRLAVLVQEPCLVDQIGQHSKAEISLACLSCLCLLDLGHNLLDPGCSTALLGIAASVRDSLLKRRGQRSCLQLRKGICTQPASYWKLDDTLASIAQV